MHNRKIHILNFKGFENKEVWFNGFLGENAVNCTPGVVHIDEWTVIFTRYGKRPY